MIPADLLARLQEADNVTWERVCQTAVGEYESFDEDGFEVKYTVSYEELFDDAKEAWLQHCLQEAIRTRGWMCTVLSVPTNGHVLDRIDTEGEESGTVEYGDTEAEALLRAYLAAIQEAE